MRDEICVAFPADHPEAAFRDPVRPAQLAKEAFISLTR